MLIVEVDAGSTVGNVFVVALIASNARKMGIFKVLKSKNLPIKIGWLSLTKIYVFTMTVVFVLIKTSISNFNVAICFTVSVTLIIPKKRCVHCVGKM